MKSLPSTLKCPGCQQELRPKLLGCDACGIRVEGPFQLNEFATLPPEDLHLLRIFVLSEGRVRDMEAPLGLSYPTIRARLKALRTKVAQAQSASAPGPESPVVDEILERLQQNELSFDEAMALIRKARGKAGRKAQR